ncbi:MAG: TonB-dependent receptor [Pseudomonadota bacterium]
MRNLTLLFLAATGGFTAAASADNHNTPKDEIIVTGALTPIEIERLGNAVTIIDRDDIERRQARYVTELLRSVPGFSVSRTGVLGAQTQVRVRGAEANHLLVLIDGVRASDPATSDEFRWEHLSTANIERIEVVRGPQSALWGSDAVAGVVHIITTQSARTTNGNAFVEAGNNSTLNVGVSGATGADRWALSGGIERLDTDGENVSRDGDEDDPSDVTTAFLSGTFDATERLSLNAGVRAIDALSSFDPVDFFVTGLPTDGDVATESSYLYVDTSAKLSARDGRDTHQLSLRFFDSDQQSLVDGADDSSTASERVTITARSSFSLGDNVLALAIEHEATDFEQRGAVGFGDPNQDQSIDVTSVVADYQWLATEQLTVLLSGRFDSNSDFDDAANGRISASYAFSDALRLRGAIGTAQKNPSFTERFGFFPATFLGNPDLEPEKSTAYEIGIDGEFVDGTVALGLTVFQQDLTDEINGFAFDAASGLFTANNIDEDSDRSGAELTASWAATDWLNVAASYTYLDASAETAAGDDLVEVRRPRHSGGLSLDLGLPGAKLTSMLTADYGGSRPDTFFPPFPASAETVTLGSYWLVGLTAQYRVTDSLTVYARADNITDSDYEEVFGYRTLGRNGYVGVRFNFGE